MKEKSNGEAAVHLAHPALRTLLGDIAVIVLREAGFEFDDPSTRSGMGFRLGFLRQLPEPEAVRAFVSPTSISGIDPRQNPITSAGGETGSLKPRMFA